MYIIYIMAYYVYCVRENSTNFGMIFRKGNYTLYNDRQWIYIIIGIRNLHTASCNVFMHTTPLTTGTVAYT